MEENKEAETRETQADKPERKVKRGPSNAIAYFALIIAITAFSGLGWVTWTEYQERDDSEDSIALEARFKALEARLSELGGDKAATEEQIRSVAGELDAVSQAYQTLALEQQEVARHALVLESQLSRLTSTDRSDWKLAEAEYLLRLANHRLRLAGETAGAMSLLGSADDILQQLDDPALITVREEIASELLQLKAMAGRDVQGVYLRLAALSELVWTLPMAFEPVLQQAEATVEAQVPVSGWRARLASLLDTLSTYFVVQRLEHAIEPMASPEQQHYFREELRLGLEQAQSALLTSRSAVYESALRKAMNLVQLHFDLEHQRTRTMVSELRVLQDYEADPELPDIGTSLNVLREHIAISHDRKREATEPEVE